MNILITVFILLITSYHAYAELDPSLIPTLIKDFYADSSRLPKESDFTRNKNTVFVLVKGFGGDEAPVSWFYFLPLKQELERLTNTKGEKNPAKKRVYTLAGNSKAGFTENSQLLQNKLNEILNNAGPEAKVFIVGHSKGAVESWTTLMRNPQMSHERLAGAVFLQGPFQGTPLADFVIAGKKPKDLEPFRENKLQYILRTAILARGAPASHRAAIEELTTPKAQEHIYRTLANHGDSQSSDFWNQTLFLWTKHEPLKGASKFFPFNNPFMEICHRALTKMTGNNLNDGFIPVPNSELPAPILNRTQVMSGFHHSAFDVGQAGRALARALFSAAP